LVVRLFGIFVTLAGSLALLARFLTAALLLTGLLTRRLILLAVRVVPIKENGSSALLTRCNGQPDIFWFTFPHSLFSLVSDCGEFNGDCFGVTGRPYA
jgi:hypothetical protein